MFNVIQSSQRIWRVLLFSLLGLALWLVAGSVQSLQGAPPETALEVAAPAAVMVGEPIELELRLRNARDVAGYEIHLQFDTAVAEFGGLRQRQNDLRRLGRDIGPLAVAELADGAAFGLFSCPTEDCVQPKGPGQARGGRGTLRLATAIISPQEPGILEIRLDSVRLVDPAGNPLEFIVPVSTITVQVGEGSAQHSAPASGWQLAPSPGPATATDITGDSRIDHADVMEVALDWVLQREQLAPCGPLPRPEHDLNQDGCIDVADVQAMVAAQVAGSEAQPTLETNGDEPTTAVDAVMADSASLAAAAEMVFTVNTTMDNADSNPGDGICASSSGCTLRAAIQEANAHQGPDRIEFNLPGSGVHTIQLVTRLTPLSDLSGGTVIDGYSQPGASPNSDPLVSNAQIRVEVRGNGPTNFDALYITSGNNVVRGIAFYNLKRSIWLYGTAADNNAIVGNFLGTNAAGTFTTDTYAYPASGLIVENGASGNYLGREAVADRNVISGNGRHGIEFHGEVTDDNRVYNNLVGLRPDGSGRLQNLKHGIDINRSASRNLIGGTAPNQRNIISGNGQLSLDDYTAGVEISHDRTTVENRVIGNCLGTDVTCQTAPSWAYNSHYGIRLEDGVSNNVVADNVIGNSREGGIQLDNFYTSGNQITGNRIGISMSDEPIPNLDFGIRIKYHASRNVVGPNNIIANNPVGVQIEFDNEDYNTIRRNTIYGNDNLGIDLGPYHGVSPNDTGDGDEGANRGLNFPTLAKASPSAVEGVACAEAIVVRPCTVEVFRVDSNPSDQGSGAYGQGRIFLGAASTKADGSFIIAVSGINVGDFVTATATDAEGNTSEFAHNIEVRKGTGPTPTPAPLTPTPSPTANATATPAPPTPTATPVSGCGGLLQEAEAAQLSGSFRVGSDSAASGGKYIHVPNGSGNAWSVSGNSNYASFCVNVTTAGTYRIKGWVHAATVEDDSFFVTVDGQPADGHLWDVALNSTYLADYVSHRGGADPVELTLSPGQYTVRLYLREDGTRLDRLELEQVR